MNTISEALAKSVAGAAGYVLMMTEDLKGDDYLHRPCEKANCAAWTMGHLVLSCRGMMTRLGATDLPELPEGFDKAYARDETAPTATSYPHIDRLRPMFKEHHDRFVAAISKLTPAQINEKLEQPHPRFSTRGEVAAFAPVHIAMHAGQISTIRRSLGRPPVI